MINTLSRWFLAIAAALLLLGAVLHTSAFPRTQAAVAASNLTRFFGQSLKGLWLIDSLTLLLLGVVFGLLALRPVLASGVVVVLLALVPLGTAGLLYIFMGLFPAAHLLLVAGVFALLAGILHAIA
jgi:hypothetical protein